MLRPWVRRLLAKDCTACEGTGRRDGRECQACIGTGLRLAQRSEISTAKYGVLKERRRKK